MRALAVTSATACALALLAGCSSSKAAAKDVTVSSCSSPTGGHPTARGTIVNHSSKASAYTIHVTFTDASGNNVGDGLAAVAKVEPGAHASWHANGTLNAKGPLTCKISSTRVLSP
ncbi:MAG TPA: FxLYD domain-containing protein [Acidimicrobiia bacterium]|nr:FxLYD domain-containing protein [Acidimicrobiia bacterium]